MSSEIELLVRRLADRRQRLVEERARIERSKQRGRDLKDEATNIVTLLGRLNEIVPDWPDEFQSPPESRQGAEAQPDIPEPPRNPRPPDPDADPPPPGPPGPPPPQN